MAKRHRSVDKSRDSDKILGDKTEVSQSGRKGGQPARKVVTRDEEKRAYERPAGATRVRGADKDEDDNDTGNEEE